MLAFAPVMETEFESSVSETDMPDMETLLEEISSYAERLSTQTFKFSVGSSDYLLLVKDEETIMYLHSGAIISPVRRISGWQLRQKLSPRIEELLGENIDLSMERFQELIDLVFPCTVEA